MMETLAIKAAEQVPNLAVLGLIVWMFLRFLTNLGMDHAKRAAEQAAALAQLNLEARSLNEQYQRVIESNTIAATRNTIALDNNSKNFADFVEAHKRASKNLNL